jgi:hypothetical protein
MADPTIMYIQHAGTEEPYHSPSLSPTMTIIHVIIAYITNDDLQYIFGQPIYYTVQLCNLYGQRSSTKMENANKQKNIHPDKSLV